MEARQRGLLSAGLRTSGQRTSGAPVSPRSLESPAASRSPRPSQPAGSEAGVPLSTICSTMGRLPPTPDTPRPRLRAPTDECDGTVTQDHRHRRCRSFAPGAPGQHTRRGGRKRERGPRQWRCSWKAQSPGTGWTGHILHNGRSPHRTGRPAPHRAEAP